MLANGSSPKHTEARLSDLAKHLRAQIQRFLEEDIKDIVLRRVQEQTRTALGVFKEALNRYKLSSLSLSYNGGKDCLVLLVLYLASLADQPDLPLTLESIYIVSPDPFPEVDEFVASTAFTYHLSLVHLKHESLKQAFKQYLDDKPQIEAIFVGTRRTDPHGGKLTHFDMTDRGWPKFMRIHPVIDWKYCEVWAFIRHLEIPYCTLYDMGYTSLGGTSDTLPNPILQIGETDRHRPAYELTADEEERLGRPQQ